MNVRIPARRLVRPAAVSLPLTPQRTFISDIFNRFRKKEKKNDYNREKPQAKNPLLDNYLKNKPATTASGAPAAGQAQPQRGTLSRSSVFEAQAAAEEAVASAQDEKAAKAGGLASPADAARRDGNATHAATVALGLADTEAFPGRNAGAMAAALHPDPRGDARWARKMVIREVQRRGRVSRTVALKRREREDLVKSQLLKTSVKKLGMLARQIQGKPIEEAILQMRFSKKKAAKSVLEHLEYARDHATVARGMGLGNVTPKDGESAGEGENDAGASKKPVEIELKNGRRKLIEDRTAIYVDQAWVGRGTYGKAYDIRGRGRAYLMRLPTTSISVVLKEEATRIRQHEDREKKRANRKVWVQLPDRPIQQQRQHVMW